MFQIVLILLVLRVKAACDGEAIITSISDLSVFQGCNTFDGNVRLENFTESQLELPYYLTEITGGLQVAHNMQLSSFNAKSLTSISGDVSIFDNPNLREIYMDKLKSLGSLYVTSSLSKGMKQLSMISLEKVERNVSLWRVNTVKMTNLTTVGRALEVNECFMEVFELRTLQEAGSITFQMNSELAYVQFISLKRVNGAIYVAENPNWRGFNSTEVSELQYIAGSITFISDSSHLDGIDFGSQLTSVDGSMSLNFPQASSINCETMMQKFKGSGVVKGKFDCLSYGSSINSESGAMSMKIELWNVLLLILIYYAID